MENSL